MTISNNLTFTEVYVESRALCLALPPNIFVISQMLIIDWSNTLNVMSLWIRDKG